MSKIHFRAIEFPPLIFVSCSHTSTKHPYPCSTFTISSSLEFLRLLLTVDSSSFMLFLLFTFGCGAIFSPTNADWIAFAAKNSRHLIYHLNYTLIMHSFPIFQLIIVIFTSSLPIMTLMRRIRVCSMDAAKLLHSLFLSIVSVLNLAFSFFYFCPSVQFIYERRYSVNSFLSFHDPIFNQKYPFIFKSHPSLACFRFTFLSLSLLTLFNHLL